MFVNDLFENKKITEGSAQDRLHRRHQELRKKSGLPDPDYYKELKASYDIEDDRERLVRQAEIKKKYKVAEANVKKPQPYNIPGYWKKLSKDELEAIAGPRYDDKDKKKKPNNTEKKQGVAEAGPFSYGAKKPRKGSVADLAARKRQEQEKNKKPIEPKDQMVGTAKVVTNEDIESYLEEMCRAGYEIVTEAATLCPECGGTAYEDKMLAEKQDACYSKVKSRYKVWPSAYASGALVRCRKVGAKNWGNKSKK